MASLNKVILIGHLTADPELKTTAGNATVTTFSIGVQRRFTKSGEAPQSDFFNIVAWRNTAEFITKFFRKGNAICIVGSLQNRSYTDKDGIKRYVTEVLADEASFVEKKSEASARFDGADSKAPSFDSSDTDTPKFEEVDSDSDLPFSI